MLIFFYCFFLSHRYHGPDLIWGLQIFQLLSKQSGLLKENQNLQGELALLKNRLAEAQKQQQQSTNSSNTNRGLM